MVKNILMRGNIFPFSPFRVNNILLIKGKLLYIMTSRKIFSKKSCMGGNVLNIRLKKEVRSQLIKVWRALQAST